MMGKRRMQRSGATWRRPEGREAQRGAVLVELTMVVPILVLLVLGMIEIGTAWQSRQNLVQASRQGTRVASHLAADPQSDQEALRAALAALTPAQRGNIEYIVIYKAGSDGKLPSPACATTSVVGQCNHYGIAQLQSSVLNNNTLWGGTGSALDRFYNPTARSNSLLGSGPEVLGVEIKIQHDWFTGIFPGSGTTIQTHSVMTLEPALT